MHRPLRAAALVAVAVGAALTLTSCTPATFVWAYFGEGSELRLAFCGSSEITMARITVSERPNRSLEEVQSAVWSGPRIRVPEGAIFASDELPEGWQTTSDLDLVGTWDRITIELYDGPTYVDSAIFEYEDARYEGWSLSPSGLFAGPSNCTSPFDHEFIEQPSVVTSVPLDVEQARANAMAEEEFWALIDSHNPNSGRASITSFVDTLSSMPADQVVAFHSQLMLQYFYLDAAVVWNEYERQQRVDYNGGSGFTHSFVAFRSAIILGGQPARDAALAAEAFPQSIQFEDLSSFAGVAAAAAIEVGYPDVRESIHLAPGFGQNTDGW